MLEFDGIKLVTINTTNTNINASTTNIYKN